LLDLLRQHPKVGVRQLARMIGVTHPVASRRLARLKSDGTVEHANGGEWVVAQPSPEPVRTHTPWVRPITVYGVRVATTNEAGVRYG
jgi:DNA-binding GntR family transcriptional regulator